MLIAETIRVALGALAMNKLRSLLTMLGIVIGVAAVISMVALGNGAQQAIRDRIATLGTTRIQVNARRVNFGGVQTQDTHRLSVDDIKLLKERSRLVVAIQPQQDRDLQVQYETKNASTQITGATPNFLQVQHFSIQAGRMFTEEENDARRRVAVLGATVLDNLGFRSPAAAIGAHIRIRGVSFEVIGTLAARGAAGGGGDNDDQVIIPFWTGRFVVFSSNRINDIHVLAPDEASIDRTMVEVARIMRRAHHLLPGQPDDFRLTSQLDILSALGGTTDTFTFLLAGIATVSLLVGGIGIMNIMLVSVTERTREIGVRKALGATRANILLQFLIEALVLSLLGGAIGVAAGAGSAVALRSYFNWNTLLDPQSIPLAFLFAASVGIVFGVWPAKRASALDPVESLRFE
jgi:putative ABC transport system permease protein